MAENQNTESRLPALGRIAEETFLMKCETDAAMLNWQTAAYYQAGYKREYPYGYEYPGRTRETPRLKCLQFENFQRSSRSSVLVKSVNFLCKKSLERWHLTIT